MPGSPDFSASSADRTGVVVVDHGSRLDASNRLLGEVVEALQQRTGWPIVEAAHMELAEPSIAAAFARCVDQGATVVVVFPYLLSPGRHSTEDIPRLAAEAAASHPGVRHVVAEPFGLHCSLLEVISERVAEATERLPPPARQ